MGQGDRSYGGECSGGTGEVGYLGYRRTSLSRE